MLKRPLLFSWIALVFVAGCVLISFIHQPGSIVAGQTLSIRVDVASRYDPNGQDEFEKPVLCLDLPTAWGVESASYAGKANSFTNVQGEMSYFATDVVQAAYPGATTTSAWRCFAAQLRQYSMDAHGTISLEITGATAGAYALRYIAGTENDPTYGSLITRSLRVDGPAEYRENPVITVRGADLQPFRAITLHAGQFFAVDAANRLYQSTQAAVWVPLETIASDEKTDRLMVANGELWAVARSLVNANESILRRRVGAQWNQVYSRTDVWMNAIVYFDGKYVVPSSGGVVVTSATGAAWADAPTLPMQPDWVDAEVASGRLFLVDSSGMPLSTTDAAQWDATDMSGGNPLLNVRFEDGAYRGFDSANDTVTSSTGVTFTTTGAAMAFPVAQAVSRSDGGFAALSGADDWATSADFTQWTPFSVGTDTTFDGIVAGNGWIVLWSGAGTRQGGQIVRYHAPEAFTIETGHDFGTIPADSTAAKRFSVENIGTGDLIFGAPSGGAGFNLVGDGCGGKLLAAQSACTFDVEFSPLAMGDFTSTLTLAVTYPTAQTLTFDLKGAASKSTTANEAPSIPLLGTPENGQTGVPTTVDLIWRKSVDPQGDRVTYDVFLCEDPAFKGCESVKIAAHASPGSRKPGLQWAGILGSLLGAVGFVFAGRRRGLQVLLAAVFVAGGMVACGKMHEPRVRSEYEIRRPGPDELAYLATGLKPHTQYHWKVVASDPKGLSAESETWSFFTSEFTSKPKM